MTDFDARLARIRRSHWFRHETDAEHEARVEAAEATAGWYFRQATEPQREAYRRSLADLMGMTAPRDERAREAALAAYEASTAAAGNLMLDTIDELLRTGEISEELSDRWEALCRQTDRARAA